MSKEKYSFLKMGPYELGPVRAQAKETAPPVGGAGEQGGRQLSQKRTLPEKMVEVIEDIGHGMRQACVVNRARMAKSKNLPDLREFRWKCSRAIYNNHKDDAQPIK